MHDPVDSVSVLMPVHSGADPAHFKRALESIYWQTRCPDEVVIVEDGPLTPELYQVLDSIASACPQPTRVRLASNSGPGVANQAGLAACTSTWIAKMDADDVSRPDRFATQLQWVLDRDVDVLGSALAEFVDDEFNVVAIRSNPLTHQQIERRMRLNSPVNHPAAFYRRALAVQVGGYPDLRFGEDYDLFARLLVSGARIENHPEALVLFRAGNAMMSRRRSFGLLGAEWQIQRNLRSYGVIGRGRMTFNFVARALIRLLPPAAVHLVYRTLNRNQD